MLKKMMVLVFLLVAGWLTYDYFVRNCQVPEPALHMIDVVRVGNTNSDQLIVCASTDTFVVARLSDLPTLLDSLSVTHRFLKVCFPNHDIHTVQPLTLKGLGNDSTRIEFVGSGRFGIRGTALVDLTASDNDTLRIALNEASDTCVFESQSCWYEREKWPAALVVNDTLRSVATLPISGMFMSGEETSAKLQIQGEIKGDITPYVHGFPRTDWEDVYSPVSGSEASELTLVNGKYIPNQPFRVLNVPDAMAAPGDYVMNDEQNELLMLRGAELDKVEVTKSKHLLIMQDCHNVVWENITLSGARAAGVVLDSCSDVRIANCQIKNISGKAVKVTNSRSIEIANNHVHHTGEGGVFVNCGDRSTLTRGNVVVKQNEIHDFNLNVYCYRQAVNVDGVGNTVSENEIYNGTHTAISFLGNDHLINRNIIHDVAQLTTDVGVIYTWPVDWTERGTTISENIIYDIPDNRKNGSSAIYLDGFASGVNVVNNVVFRSDRSVLINGGHDIKVAGNLFIDCAPAVLYDAAGYSYSAKMFNGEDSTLKKLFDYWTSGPLYFKHYPELVSYQQADLRKPRNISIDRNLFVRTSWEHFWTVLVDQSREFDFIDDVFNQKIRLEETVPEASIVPVDNLIVQRKKVKEIDYRAYLMRQSYRDSVYVSATD